MSETAKATADLFTGHFGDRVSVGDTQSGITTIEIGVDDWLEICRALRDEDDFSYEQLTDLCGVDYLSYGMSEWDTEDASQEGFGRGVEAPMLVILLGAIGGMIMSGIVGLFVGAVLLALGYKLLEAWLVMNDEDEPAAAAEES